MPSEMPALSAYALCDAEDVAELLGYTDQQMSNRQRTLIRTINASAVAIRRRTQREFKQTEAEQDQRRFFLVENADVRRGYVRIGDMAEWPSEVRLWTPDRDDYVEFDVDEDDGDIFPLPDVPEPGMPYEYLKVKSTQLLTAGWWLSVTSGWGFPAVPDDIIQVAIGTAAEWVLNDVMKLSELARQQGRPVRLASLIPSQYDETVDGYRIYRVS
jgi:hypothetical protein